jgi:hypothetical protein
LAARFLRIVDRGVRIHILMGRCLDHTDRVSTVAALAGNLAVRSGKKFFGNEDLFLWLQLSHRPTSACA